LRSVGGYDERYTRAQDLQLLLRIRDHAHFQNSQSVFVDYRFPRIVSPGRYNENYHFHRLACREAGLLTRPPASGYVAWANWQLRKTFREDIRGRILRRAQPEID
jgi:hypothetical protein